MNARPMRAALALSMLMSGASVYADPPRPLTPSEWEAQRSRYTGVSLPRVGSMDDVSRLDSPPRAAAGEVVLTQCQPGGSSESLWRENATGALWLLRTVGGMRVLPGVVISATRCFAQCHRLPAGERVVGTLVVSYRSSVER